VSTDVLEDVVAGGTQGFEEPLFGGERVYWRHRARPSGGQV
jgi:hypothetical protein